MSDPRWTRRSRRGKALAVLVTAVLLLTGCGFRGATDLPLPGGADVGDKPYRVTIQFADVLDLVPNAGVRVNDVPVGRVVDVNLAPNSWQAQALVEVNGGVELPANATARLRQSSLLGEKFVELSKPPEQEGEHGRLRDGARIGVDRTGRNPEVEEVLGALSLLLNGGGVAQIQSITKELNSALGGREADVRGLLNNLDTLVSSLDAQRDDITRALDGVNRLSASLNSQRSNVDVALRDLGGGLQVLNEQRGQLVTMLQSLDRLSGVATDTVQRSQEDTVHNLRSLQPTLQELSAAGSDLPNSLETLFTYPFPDNAVDGMKNSDYTNLYMNVDLNLTQVVDNLTRTQQPPIEPPDPVKQLLPLPSEPPPSKPAAPPPKPQQEDSGGLLDKLFGGR